MDFNEILGLFLGCSLPVDNDSTFESENYFKIKPCPLTPVLYYLTGTIPEVKGILFVQK